MRTFTFGGSSPRTRLVVVLLVASAAVVGWFTFQPSAPADAAPTPEAFSVLNRPASPADARVSERTTVAGLADHMPVVPGGARVLSSTATAALVLVPRTDGLLCLELVRSDGGWSGSCPDLRTATAQGIAAGLPGAMIGVVPDGVKRVDFRFPDGTTSSIAPSNGIYAAPAEAVEATVYNGESQYKLELVPKGAFKNLTMSVPRSVADDIGALTGSQR